MASLYLIKHEKDTPSDVTLFSNVLKFNRKVFFPFFGNINAFAFLMMLDYRVLLMLRAVLVLFERFRTGLRLVSIPKFDFALLSIKKMSLFSWILLFPYSGPAMSKTEMSVLICVALS
jgi:hypothetical protein